MDGAHEVHDALTNLCKDIERWISEVAPLAQYRAPIIDWHHPDDYGQRGIQGLRKFLAHAAAERDHVESIINSGIPPRELTTNAPNVLAVWDEFVHATPPLAVISQSLECGDQGVAKVDVVADGGNEWIKVNTMKESRLMAEFHEQDSYVNSDYDSDSDSNSMSTEESVDNNAGSTAGSGAGGSRILTRGDAPEITNSLITQATSLLRAAAAFPRPRGQPVPRIVIVLTRLEEFPHGGYDDPRVPATFAQLRDLGVDLRFGPPIGPRPSLGSQPKVRPTRKILLDLSVIVALCCDSTHQPLPLNDEELESRFRPLHRGVDGTVDLSPHTNVTSDLRDQLRWEMQHPLIGEMIDRLAHLAADDEELEFWTSREVKSRMPGILDVMGGPEERARARALVGEGGDFWKGSRWKGKEGVLKGLRARVLDEAQEGFDMSDLSTHDLPIFQRGLVIACKTMLDIVEPPPPPSDTAPITPPTLFRPASPIPTRGMKGNRSKHPKRPSTIFPPARLPSGHTLRILSLGARKGWTVLTNNRGAVGKVCREMGVQEGLPDREGQGRGESMGSEEVAVEAAVWVVNPSSLAEWRRIEVEKSNMALQGQREDESGLGPRRS